MVVLENIQPGEIFCFPQAYKPCSMERSFPENGKLQHRRSKNWRLGLGLILSLLYRIHQERVALVMFFRRHSFSINKVWFVCPFVVYWKQSGVVQPFPSHRAAQTVLDNSHCWGWYLTDSLSFSGAIIGTVSVIFGLLFRLVVLSHTT